MKKIVKLLSILVTLTSILLNTIAWANYYQDIKFNYQHLISATNLVTETQDNNGNLYYATFDSPNIRISGEKIWKYNIITKDNELYWANKNFRVGSFNMIVDIKGNIYLTSSGGVKILNNKNQVSNMPLVSGMVTDIICFKNDIYVTTFDGFYKYNIDSNYTKKIDLPDDLIANSVFIDKNENIYLGIYNATNCGVLMIKKGELEMKRLIGDDFFNSNIASLIIEIDNKVYFYSLNLQNNNEAKLYDSDLGSTKVEHLLDLPINTKTIFNLNNKIGLITYENEDTIIYQVLNINVEKKYQIKNTFYNKVIQNRKHLYFSNENNIDCLNW